MYILGNLNNKIHSFKIDLLELMDLQFNFFGFFYLKN